MSRTALVVPVLFSLALTLPGITRKGFLHEDEWRNAVMVREMAASGPALFPTLHGEPYPDYPPLYFLSALTVAKLQGSVTPLAVRFPAAIGAALMAFGTALLALRLASARTALVAGVLVSVIPGLHYEARRAMIDPLLSGFVCVAVALMAQPTRRSFALGFVFVALAWLTKGPLGAVMVGLALAGGEGLVLASSPSGPALKWLQVRAFVFVIAVVAIAFVWFGLAFGLHGSAFGKNLLWEQTIGRFFKIEQHAKPVYYYFVTTVPILLPVLAFCASIRKTKLSLFGIGWFVLLLVFFSLSKTKRSYYLMPAYPAVALVAAEFFSIPFRRTTHELWHYALMVVLVLGVVLGVIWQVEGDRIAPYSFPVWLPCLLGLASFIVLLEKERPALAFASVVAFMLATISASVVPMLTPRHGHEQLATKLAKYEHVAVSPSGAHREALCWYFAPSAVEGMPNVDGRDATRAWLGKFPRGTACVLLHVDDHHVVPSGEDDANEFVVIDND